MMRAWPFLLLALTLMIAMFPYLARAQSTTANSTFPIKYIAQDAVYIEGGRAAGLKEGEILAVHRVAPPGPDSTGSSAPPISPSDTIATLKILSVADSSAVCEVQSSTVPIQIGDVATITAQEAVQAVAKKQQERLSGSRREYPQLITFTTADDPVAEEVRASVPRPPSPEIDRMRGRIGIEYDTIITRNNPTSTSKEVGLVARFEMNRIGGTYWNFDGYWHGRFSTLSGPAAPATISDLINRTYTLNLQYNNPNSALVAGVGRLYVPWATSLNVLDGGYVGRRAGHATVGIFAGTTPDPSSYDYSPDGKLAGTFVNFSGGSFENVRYSATFGAAVAAIGWHATRQFGFDDVSVSLGQKIAVYNALEIDLPHNVLVAPAGSPLGTTPTISESTGGLNRSYLSFRYQPLRRLQLQLNDTYFRDFPSFDPSLISTGLLESYLFQGLSGGFRLEIVKQISVDANIGKSSRSGDSSNSWNQSYGLTFGELAHTGVRADVRYSKFSSSFGSGEYKSITISRPLSDTLQFQILGGIQNFNSPLTSTTQAHFVTSYLDWFPKHFLFFEPGYTWQRGGSMNYDQFQIVIGRRF
jgi:Flagellar assembly protein T, C-terminal domain